MPPEPPQEKKLSRHERIAARKEARAARKKARSERKEARAARRAAERASLEYQPAEAKRSPAAVLEPLPELKVKDTPFRTADGQPLEIHGLFRGSTAFMLLAGPSLNDLDLSPLNRRGIVSIGVNQSPVMHRANFWCYVDRARKFHDAIWKDPGVLKIVPSRHFSKPLQTKLPPADGQPEGEFSIIHRRQEDRQQGDRSATVPAQVREFPGVIGYKRNATFNPDEWLSQGSVNWGNARRPAKKNGHPRCLNVMFASIKIAYALGFRNLFLLGCDFYMEESQPYAFGQAKHADGCASNNNCYRMLNEMFGLLKPKFDDAGFRVFNCNPRSGFRVFPHVAYEDAVEFATSSMPPEPLDAAGWYESL